MNWIAETLLNRIAEAADHAFLFDERTKDGLTYAQIGELSGRVYAWLKAKGIGREDFVLVNLPRGVKPIVAEFGVWRAGAAFALVEDTYAPERIAFIRKDCACKLEIDAAAWEEILKTEPREGFEDVGEHDAAYAIYTSGTTGTPKGVLHEYGNLKEAADSIRYADREICASDDRTALVAPLNFVASVIFVVKVLTLGRACIHVVPYALLKSPLKFALFMNLKRITTTFLTPSYVRAFVSKPFPFLKRLFVGSEPANGVEPGKLEVVNIYAMSESGFAVGVFRIDRKYDVCPVGRPPFDCKVRLVGEDGRDVPDGEIGELWFENRYVRGYLNRPEETAKSFVGGFYRTGDLARRLPSGDYAVCGRATDMVKINGNRVEPAEIEAVAKEVLGVDWCAARGFEDDAQSFVALYYTADIEVDVDAVRAKMARKLPYYMLPQHFVRIEKVPQSANGKFSRRLLPKPAVGVRFEDIVPPETDFERRVFALVAAEIGTEAFGVTTNLLSLGLTSLRAIRLSAAVGRELGLSLSALDMIAHPCVRDWEPLATERADEIPVSVPQAEYPLTANQLGVYFDCLQHPDGIQYNVPFAVRFPRADAARLAEAVLKAVAAHPALKARVADRNGTIVQLRRDEAELPVLFETLDTAPDAAFFQARVRPFSLTDGDLARVEVFKAPDAAYLFVDVHHILFDGGSANVMLKAIAAAYDGGEPAGEAATAFDLALYDAAWKESPAFAEAERHFDALVAGTESYLHAGTAGKGEAGREQTCFETVPLRAIRARCRELGVTENAFFATALTQIFHRLSREDAVQISTISNGRSLAQLADTVGMFVQTLPLVSRVARGPAAAALRAMQEGIVASMAHERYPYSTLSARHGVKPNVLYAYQGDVIESGALEGELACEQLPLALGVAKAPLSFDIAPKGDGYEIRLDYDAGLYAADEAATLARTLGVFAEAMAAHPADADIAAIPLVSEAETKALLSLGQGERLEYDRTETFVTQFLRAAKEHADRTAVVDAISSISYRELDAKSDSLAAELVRRGVAANDFVGIQLPRVKEFMVAAVAVMKAGGAYVPLDPEYPADRLAYMVEDSGAKVVIDPAFLAEFGFAPAEPSDRSRPEGLAYMIYTSGSTGKPKGVMVSHRALRAFIEWHSRLVGLKPGEKAAEHSSFCFDASTDMFSTLTRGAELHIFSETLRNDLVGMNDYIREQGVKSMDLIPSVGNSMMADFDVKLDYLGLGGEKVTPFKPCRIRVANTYGPTEFTNTSVVGMVDQTFPYGVNIPIGRPVPNSFAAIVDPAGNLVPRGMVGELCSVGDQIAEGYWRREDLTREKFVDAPFMPGRKMYRTGDLACWNGDDDIVCLGRVDHQVKLRGFRIELGEIEARMLEYPGIRQAIAEVKKAAGVECLCAYYVAEGEVDEGALRSKLAESLTEYMVPTHYLRLEAMPLNPAGKVDRKALPLPEMQAAQYVAPEGEIETAVAETMAEVLGTDIQIGRDDDFFALGGDSIKSIRLVSKLRQEGYSTSVPDILKTKTVKGIARSIELRRQEAAASEKNAAAAAAEDWPADVLARVRAEFAARGEELERVYPLTGMQEEMLLKVQMDPEAASYHLTTRLSLAALPDREQLTAAFGRLVAKNEVLRTAIVHEGVGEPMQAIVRDRPGCVTFEDVSAEADPEAAVRAIETREFERKVDLQRDPLFRMVVVKTAADACQVMFVYHHIIVDGWCTALFLRDFARFLDEAREGRAAADGFASEKGRYERHVRELKGRDREAAHAYWGGLLDGYDAKAEIPAYEKVTDATRDPRGFASDELDAATTGELVRQCRGAGCTVNNAVEAAWGLVLQAYGRSEDAVFVKVVSGRDNASEDVSDVVGLFINSVPVRVRTDRNSTLIGVVRDLQRQAAETSSWDWCPLADIQTLANVGGGLFQSILAFENYEGGEETGFGAASGLKLVAERGSEASELSVMAMLRDGRLALSLLFDTSKYPKDAATRILAVFRRVLELIARTPQAKAQTLPLVDGDETRELVSLGTGDRMSFDRTETFVDQFLRSAKAYPDVTAMVDPAGGVTYRELDEKSDALAAKLVELGVGKDTFVATLMPRVKEFMVAVLGIWKAGGAYLPLGTEYPKDRLRYMMEDSGATILVTETELFASMADANLPAKTVIDLCDFDFSKRPAEPFDRSEADGLAYMIYTSGTTGKPKGAMLEHRNLRAFNEWLVRLAGLGPGVRIPVHASFSFDGSCLDLYPSLSVGGEVHVLDGDVRQEVTAMAKYLKDRRIKGLFLTTRLAQELLEMPDLSIEYLMMGGEKNFGFKPSNVRVYEVYGPTETTILATAGLTDQTFPDPENIPIGRPAPNLGAVILDRAGQLVPRGMAGELCIVGPQVCRGYWKRPDLTAEKFADCPWFPGERMYHSGDLCRWNADGNIQFLGRIDKQVKIRGFRIEPSEVEEVILRAPGVKAATVQVFDDPAGGKFLCAYVVGDRPIDAKALEDFILSEKPPYMVPAVTMQIDRIPLNQSQKVDRKALPKPERKADADAVPPETEMQKRIFELAAGVLAHRAFGIDTSLYAAGLTSIGSMRLNVLLGREYGCSVTIKALKENDTVRKLEAFVTAAAANSAVRERRADYPITKTQTGILVECQTNPGSTVYNIPFLFRLGANVDADRLVKAVESAVNAHPYVKTRLFEDESGTVRARRRDDAPVNVRIVDGPLPEAQSLVRPFDLLKDDLYRVEIYRTGEGTFLFTDFHHIVCDGSSEGIVFRDIDRAYAGEKVETETYGGFEAAEDEEAALRTPAFDRAKAHWEQLCAGVEPECLPPYDTEIGEAGLGRVTGELSVAAEAVDEFCKGHDVSANAFFNAVFGYVLAKYAGRRDAIYTTIYNGRSDSRTANSVSMYVKTLPVAFDYRDEIPVAEAVKSVGDQLMAGMSSDLFSFADIARAYGVRADVLFVYQGDAFALDTLCGEKCEEIPLLLDRAKAQLNFEMQVRDGRYEWMCEYDRALYSEWLMRGFGECVSNVAEAFLDRERLGDVDICSAAQLKRLDALNRTEVAYDGPGTVVDLFRASAEKYPGNVAVVHLEKSFTYREVDEMSDRIAAYLLSKGVKREDFVAILIPRCEYMTIASLGVSKTGAAYQPLDPTYPPERLGFMVEDTQAKFLIADEKLLDRLGGYAGEVLLTKDIPSLPPTADIAAIRAAAPKPENAFIILYTSGSTGKPKGAILEHRSLVNFCNWYPRYFDMDETAHVAAYASYGFDACMMDMYPTLAVGAAVYIVDDSVRFDLDLLNAYFAKVGITHSFMTTQVCRQFAQVANVPTLRHLTASGEKLVPIAPPKGFKFYNGGGPTECTIYVAAFQVEKLYRRVPLGYPLANLRAYVVDERGRRLPPGVPGELWVSSVQISRHYLNNPEKTAAAYGVNPFTQEPGYERIYRTGDICRLQEDGLIDIIGRRDGMVKVRGFRIEVAEVEEVIRRFPGIRDATVQAFDDPSGNGKFIAAYVVSDAKVDVEAMNDFIRAEKPPYLVPAVTMQIDKIPLNQNQKVNRRALPKPVAEKTVAEFVEPATEDERTVAEAFRTVLGLKDPVGAESGFYSLGGDSIKSMRLMSVLRRKGYVLTVGQITKLQTPRALAPAAERILPGEESDVFVEVPPERLEDAFASENEFEQVRADFAARGEKILRAYPLTPLQNAMFVKQATDPLSWAYRIVTRYELDFLPTAEQLRAAVDALAARNEMLRTAVVSRGVTTPLQVITDRRIEVNYLADPAGYAAERIRDLHRNELVRGFDLQDDSLLRVTLIQTGAATCQLMVAIHHIVMDGWSMALYTAQLLGYLKDAMAGKRLEVPTDTAGKFEQHVRAVGRMDRTAGLAYWKGLLGDYETQAEIPSFGTYPDSTEDDLVFVDVPPERTKRLREVASSARASLANAVEFAWGAAVGRYCRQDDVVFARIVSGRDHAGEGMDAVVGPFINNVPVRVRMRADQTLADILRSVSEQAAESSRWDFCATGDIQSVTDLGSGLFQSCLAFENYPADDNESGAPTGVRAVAAREESFNDIAVAAFETPDGGLRLRICFDRHRFRRVDVERLSDAVGNLLGKLAESPDATYGETSLWRPEQEAGLLEFCSGGEVEFDRTQTFVDLFLESVRRNPDAEAVVDRDGSMTYRELDEASNRMANYLREQWEVCPGDFVMLVMPRVKEYLVCVIGTQKAGAAYVPVDPAYPTDRRRFMAQDSDAKAILTPLAVSEALSGAYPADPVNLAKPDGLAYMIYTSGSTGKPKGAMVYHRGLLNLIHYLVSLVTLTSADRIAAHRSFSFDAHVEDLFPILSVGGSMHIMPEEIRRDPTAMHDFFVSHGITGGGFTTALTKMFVQSYPDLPLRFIGAGGEKLDGVYSDRMTIVNCYGPTECTCDSSIFVIRPGERIVEIPIGKPLPNTSNYILDVHGHLLPPGVVGELCIAGRGVGRGYFARPKLTRAKFVACPWRPGDMMYHTGDLCRMAEDGNIIYVGRFDNQIKLRGFRIELGEIESVALQCAGVRQVIAKVSASKLLCLYFVGDCDEAAVREHLAKKVQSYMVPDFFCRLERMPLTPNGKLDRKALPEPQGGSGAVAQRHVEPETMQEKLLCRIFGKELHADSIGVTDSLKSYGVTSLVAMRLTLLLAAYHIHVRARDIVEQDSVRGILSCITEKDGSDGAYFGREYRPGLPTVVVSCGVVSTDLLTPKLKNWLENCNVYVLEPVFNAWRDFEKLSYDETVDRFEKRLFSDMHEGERVVAFMGFSFGGKLSYELARRWNARSGQLAKVLLGDTRIDPESLYAVRHPADEANAEPLELWMCAYFDHIGDPLPIPGYKGEVVLYNARRDFDPKDRSVELWKEILPSIRVVDVDDNHNGLFENAGHFETYRKEISLA